MQPQLTQMPQADLQVNSHDNYTGPRPTERALAAANPAPAAAAATATVPKADGKVDGIKPPVDGIKPPEKDPTKYLGPN